MKANLENILDYFVKKNPPIVISSKTKATIKKIISICNKKYSDKNFSGNSALNRAILLDEKIALLLTPDTILAIMHYQAFNPSKIMIKRSKTKISLAAALYYGFKEGLEAIEFISNNQKSNTNIGTRGKKQGECFQQHTQTIISHINAAESHLAELTLMDFDPHSNELSELDEIEKPKPSIKKLIEIINRKITYVLSCNLLPKLLGQDLRKTPPIRPIDQRKTREFSRRGCRKDHLQCSFIYLRWRIFFPTERSHSPPKKVIWPIRILPIFAK